MPSIQLPTQSFTISAASYGSLTLTANTGSSVVNLYSGIYGNILGPAGTPASKRFLVTSVTSPNIIEIQAQNFLGGSSVGTAFDFSTYAGGNVYFESQLAYVATLNTSATAAVGGDLSGNLPNPTVISAESPSITGGTITDLSTLSIRDTSAAHDVILAATSSTPLTTNRKLTVDVADASSTLKVPSNATVSGVNTGDQTLSGLGGIPLTQKGAANGVATLDSGVLVPATQLPLATAVSPGAAIALANAFDTTGANFAVSARVPVLPNTAWDYARSGNSNLLIGDGGTHLTTSNLVLAPIDPLSWELNGSANGTHNTINGIGAGLALESGNYNTLNGTNAGRALRNGTQNTISGAWSGMALTDAWHNSFYGVGCGQDIVHCYLNALYGCDNSLSATGGNGCSSFGASASSVNAGDNNNSFGCSSFASNVGGHDDCTYGSPSLQNNVSGSYLCAYGNGSLGNLKSGNYTIGIGYHAGSVIAGGGDSVVAATSCIYLGANTQSAASGRTNEIVIGDSAVGLGSNTTVVGNASTAVTRIWGNVGLGTSNPGTLVLSLLHPNSNAYIMRMGTTDALNTQLLIQVDGSTVNPSAVLLVGNNNGNTPFTLQGNGAFTAAYFKTSTAVTANSTGTVSIVNKTASTGVANAGWLPMKKSDDVVVYVPFWT